MVKRMHVANFIAFLGIGLMLAPVEVFARSGGFHRFGVQPIVQVAPLRQHRRIIHFGLPLTSGYVFAPRYYNYEQADDISPVQTSDKPVTENRHGCDSQNYKVPSSDGSESNVTIIRC